MQVHCGYPSGRLRLQLPLSPPLRTWCNWITHQSTKLKIESSSLSILALSPGSSVLVESAGLKNQRSSVRFRPGGLAHCPIAQWQSTRLLTAMLQVRLLLGQPFIAEWTTWKVTVTLNHGEVGTLPFGNPLRGNGKPLRVYDPNLGNQLLGSRRRW